VTEASRRDASQAGMHQWLASVHDSHSDAWADLPRLAFREPDMLSASLDQPSLMDRAREAAGDQDPQSPLEIDTSDADMGPAWQAQLAALDTRLDARTREDNDVQRPIPLRKGQ
jgi:hypothetical protein